MIEESDELIERAVRTLSAMPPVRAGAVARVLMAVRANQARPLPFWKRAARRFEETSVSGRAAALMMAASLVIGFFARGPVTDALVPFTTETDLSGAQLQSVANVPAESRTVPVSTRLLAPLSKISYCSTVSGMMEFVSILKATEELCP